MKKIDKIKKLYSKKPNVKKIKQDLIKWLTKLK